MREIAARIVCLLTVVMVFVLAHVFAARHNPRVPASVNASAVKEQTTPQRAPLPALPAELVRGREIYAAQNCSACHAIAGVGNPRNPLDDVGARRSRGELRGWITATGAAAGQLAPAVVRRKQRYRELPAEDLDALVAYLATLAAKA